MTDGVTFKRNAGRGASRASKGRVDAMNRGKFGFDFSVSIRAADGEIRVLYMTRADAYDLADCLDTVLAETESKDGREAG